MNNLYEYNGSTDLFFEEFLVNAKLFLDDNQEQKLRLVYDFALQKHGGTVRDLGEPFIMHPLRVAYLCLLFVNEDKEFDKKIYFELFSSAILHDILEDTDTDKTELEFLFGLQISNDVSLLSMAKIPDLVMNALSEEQKIVLSRDQITRYYENIYESDSDCAKIIKICDKVDNLNTIKGLFKRYDINGIKKYINRAKMLETYAAKYSPSLQKNLQESIKAAKSSITLLN